MEQSLLRANIKIFKDSDFSPRGIPLSASKTNKPVLIAILSTSCPWCTRAADELVILSKNNRIEVGAVILGNGAVGSTMLRATKSAGVPAFFLFKNNKFKGNINGFKDANFLVQYSMNT